MKDEALDLARPNGDLTINQRRTAVFLVAAQSLVQPRIHVPSTWDMWSGNHMGHIEEALHEMTKKEKNA